MAEIALFDPLVLAGVVNKLPVAQSLVLLNALPKVQWPFPSAEWDVIRGSRNAAQANVPNNEADLVGFVGRDHITSRFAYTREKKALPMTYMHWVRQAGTQNLERAEAVALRELQDLSNRADIYYEYSCWQALKGTLPITGQHVNTVVDFQMQASHKPSSVSKSWADSDITPMQIASNVNAWKLLVERDGHTQATDAWTTTNTIQRIFDAFYRNGAQAGLLTDRMRDAFYEGRVLPGFMGLDWHAVDDVYETANGTVTNYVAEDSIFITASLNERFMEFYEGPTADDSAPDGFIGKFSKSWKQEDPSQRQILVEWHALPVLKEVDKVVYVADVKDTTP